MGGCIKFKALIAGAVLLVPTQHVGAFLLFGRMLPAEMAPGDVNFNTTDDPKELKQIFRWNQPHLAYFFDQTFRQNVGTSRPSVQGAGSMAIQLDGPGHLLMVVCNLSPEPKIKQGECGA